MVQVHLLRSTLRYSLQRRVQCGSNFGYFGVPFEHYRQCSSSKDPLHPNPPNEKNDTTEEQRPTTEPRTDVVVFPWRHEDHPLPRFVEGTDEYVRLGHLLYSVTNQVGDRRMNMLATAFMFLNIPLYQLLLFGSWKGELADNMSWAFTQGVAGLLSHWTTTSSKTISWNTIIQDTYEINFHTTVGGRLNNGVQQAETTTEHSKQVNDPEGSMPLQNILEKKLIDLYTKARDSIAQETEICLKTYPYSAELVSLDTIPYISRENVKKDTKLLAFYRELMCKPPQDRNSGMTKLRKEKLEAGIMESTVIAQVLVWCNEVFFVKDVESGKVIQGTDDFNTGRNVCHLLRMESRVRTVKDQQGSFKNIQDDWIITDIDDLLGGNLIV
jgi:hypothetical protein